MGRRYEAALLHEDAAMSVTDKGECILNHRQPIRYVAERTPSDPSELGDVRLYAEYEDESTEDVGQVVYHSPTGVEWGYGGSGPADMALTILAHFYGVEPEPFAAKIKTARVLSDNFTERERWVMHWHSLFKFQHVANADQRAPMIVYAGDIQRFEQEHEGLDR